MDNLYDLKLKNVSFRIHLYSMKTSSSNERIYSLYRTDKRLVS